MSRSTAFVVSLNLHRRHLSESQRGMVAAKLANLGEGRPAETAQICAVSQDRAAEMLNVSRRTVQAAAKVKDAGAPELVLAVEVGRVPGLGGMFCACCEALLRGRRAKSGVRFGVRCQSQNPKPAQNLRFRA